MLAVLTAWSAMDPLITMALLLNAALVGVGLVLRIRVVPRRVLVIGWFASIPVIFLLVSGLGGNLLPSVSSNLWGGLLLTMILAAVGILLSFPLGVLLALGRRS